MSVVVNTNVASLNAQRNLTNTQNALNKAMERLSSGLRINRAADDAAGLAISEKMKAQIRSSNQASRNAMDGVSLVQVAEGAYDEIGNIMIRLRELAVQSANGILSASDRSSISTEVSQLTKEISRIAGVVQFNGTSLLAGTGSAPSTFTGITFTLQVGIGTTSNDTVQVTIQPGVASAFGSGAIDLTALALSSASQAVDALSTIDNAIAANTTNRAQLGAAQNRLEAATRNLAVAVENLSAANSRIRDVDVAQETAELTRDQILSQAGAAVLAQANQVPALALALLK